MNNNPLLKIYNPEEGLNELSSCIDKFSEERFLYALHFKNFDLYEIDRKRNKIAFFTNKLDTEYIELKQISETFNLDYAPDNNKCFVSAYDLLKRIRSSIKETVKTFMSFCKRKSQREIANELLTHIERTYAERSYLCSDIYSPSMFGFESYPPSVHALFNEMTKFFTLLKACMRLCIEVINEEKRTKANGDLSLYLFEEFYSKTYNELSNLFKYINIDELRADENPALSSLKKYQDLDSWARHNFHNYSKKDCQIIVLQDVLCKHRNLTKDEISLFGTDEEKILLYREIIRNFEKLLPNGYTKKNLDPMLVLMLLEYMECKNYSKGIKYFNNIYLQSNDHRFGEVEYGTVMSYRKVFHRNSAEYINFKEDVEALVESLKPRQNQLKIIQTENQKRDFLNSQNVIVYTSHS